MCLQESENLQKENAALKKEVKQLTEEAKYLSSVLSSHEPLCTGLAPQTPELLYPPHHSSYHHQHITVPHYQHWPDGGRAANRRLTSMERETDWRSVFKCYSLFKTWTLTWQAIFMSDKQWQCGSQTVTSRVQKYLFCLCSSLCLNLINIGDLCVNWNGSMCRIINQYMFTLGVPTVCSGDSEDTVFL